ncbi:hypothetical protein PTKIN_Ptkin08bG0063600 [Pterospermum kingtungense]
MEMEASSANDRLHFGKMGYGCQHYRRRCRIRAPCCNEVFSCRHCHNEAASMLSNPFDRHEFVRQDVKQVICSVCDIEQPVFQTGHVMLNDNSDVAVIFIGCEIFKDCVLELEPYSEWVQSDGIGSWKYPANSKASSYGKRKVGNPSRTKRK